MEIISNIAVNTEELRLIADALDFKIKQDIFGLQLLIKNNHSKEAVHWSAVNINKRKELLTKLRIHLDGERKDD